MRNRFTLSLYRDDMGTFTQPGCRDAQDALWHINDARGHDGLAPLTLAHLQTMLANPRNSVARATLTREN